MKVVGAREFRQSWTKLTSETVAVTSNGREIGYWVPIGTDEWTVVNDVLRGGKSSGPSGESGTGSTDERGESPRTSR